MIARITNQRLLRPQDFKPSHSDLKVVGVFNPGAIRFGQEVILLVRVAEAAKEERFGLKSSPRIIGHDARHRPQYAIDWFSPDESFRDPRKYKLKDGFFRLSSVSHLEIVRLARDGVTIQSIAKHPDLFGRGPYETYGIEDARITKIDDTFYITYVCVSPEMGAATALLSTKDFHTFRRQGIIFPWENKDVVVFPQKIDNNYWAYIRPIGNTLLKSISIMTAQSQNLVQWGGFKNVLAGAIESSWDSSRVGMGPPPLKTQSGWLILYHEVVKRQNEQIGHYVVHAALANSNNPSNLLARTHEPMLVPETAYEKEGFVPNVIFPTGLIESLNNPDHLLLYYGAADSSTGMMTLSKQEIITHLQ